MDAKVGRARVAVDGRKMTREQTEEFAFAELVDAAERYIIARESVSCGRTIGPLSQIGKSKPILEVVSERTLLEVDYSKLPSFGKEYEIVEHPDRNGLVSINTAKIQWMVMLGDGECYVDGEENLARLKATEKVLLDARVKDALLAHPKFIPSGWTRLYFFGTIFIGKDRRRHVPQIYLTKDGWQDGLRWLGNPWRAGEPAG